MSHRQVLFLLVLVISVHTIARSQNLSLGTDSGKPFSFAAFKQHKVSVLIFVSPECPLCQGYSLTMRKLYQQFTKKGIGFYAVVAGNAFSKQDVVQYKKQYQVPFTIVYDSKHELVAYLKATITPEVFVMGTKGNLLYSGRIDNWAYAPGKKRSLVTEHDLENALNAVVAGKPVPVIKTKAIGCFIE